MSNKTFDYAGISTIEVDAPESLLDRISDNVEGERKETKTADCVIKVNQSCSPVEIKKDKRFGYSTIERAGTEEQPVLRYYRYNTHVRTINQKSFSSYEVDSNTLMDESSVLICVRNHLSNHPGTAGYPLLHASLINLEGNGILIAGNLRQGKTTLTTYLLQEHSGVLVSDENLFLDFSKQKLGGLYMPRTVRVRFETIAKSKLSRALEDLSLTNATQYLDSEFIEETLKSRNFTGEWGLVFSRGAFCRLLGVSSQESSAIDTVLFSVYKEGKEVEVRQIESDEGIQRLSMSGLVKKSDINLKELPDTTLDLRDIKNKELNFLEVAFSGMDCLTDRGVKL